MTRFFPTVGGLGSVLEQSPLFSRCSPRERRALSAAATTIQVETGYVLTEQGSSGHEFAIVLDGIARVDVDGHTVATLAAGDCFGEMSLLDDGPRTATITAAIPMTLAVIGRREFSALLDASPTLARTLLATLARRLRASVPATA